MADSVDRVFVHALNTVKKIPKTGAARPPAVDRMRLYGLYKQAMEGDVDGVMIRPNHRSGLPPDELRREQDKWDAWNSQRGLSRTGAKQRYIETLIETMHTYATTPSAAELVAELEFVWNQIKDNQSPSLTSSYPKDVYETADDNYHGRESASQRPTSAGMATADAPDGPLKVLSPMSEQDEADREHRMRLIEEEMEAAAEEEDDDDELDDDDDGTGHGIVTGRGGPWAKKMERAMVKLSAEVAALREQISAGREFRSRQEKRPTAWLRATTWVVFKHFTVDVCILAVVLLWFRRRKDRRMEDHVRGILRVLREYARKVLPSR